MSNPNYPINPELSLREQAVAVVNFWKEQNYEKVSYNANAMLVTPGKVEGEMTYDIDDDKVIMWLVKSMEQGREYKINKE